MTKMARLIKEIEHWIEIAKRADREGSDKYENYAEAYEHVLVMIDKMN